MSLYRQTLQANIRSHRALLILDGHASRECPIGLLLLRNAKIDVLTLPGHTTHVTQMFDVILASPLKTEYTKLLNKLLKQWGIKRGEHTLISPRLDKQDTSLSIAFILHGSAFAPHITVVKLLRFVVCFHLTRML